MTPESAREIAIRIIDEFEELLEANKITVPSADREGRPDEACIYGRAYYVLEERITAILAEAMGLPSSPPATPHNAMGRRQGR